MKTVQSLPAPTKKTVDCWKFCDFVLWLTMKPYYLRGGRAMVEWSDVHFPCLLSPGLD